MKNIFILPTDKPSRLQYLKTRTLEDKISYILQLSENFKKNNSGLLSGQRNIYITSDEEPRLDEWGVNNKNGVLFKCKGFVSTVETGRWDKKIILTTDQDLIKNGVQAIDDEFLEWFVKNPTCEFVETHIVKLCTNCGQQYCDNLQCRGYEDKKTYLISVPENTNKTTITYCKGHEIKTEEVVIPKEEPKQETLEEFIDRTIDESFEIQLASSKIEKYMKIAAKWQEQRMYSEKEVKEIALKFHKEYAFTHATKWAWFFEQFKKK